MSAVFSFQRFVRLARAHWSENARDYKWFIAVVVMLESIFLAVGFGLNGRTFGHLEFRSQLNWFCIKLVLFSAIFAGRYFRNLAHPGSALLLLMQPASVTEKWLLAFTVVGLLFPIAYFAAYASLNYPAVLLARALYVAPTYCGTCSQLAKPDFTFFVPFFGATPPDTVAHPMRFFCRQQVLGLLWLWSAEAALIGGTVFFKRSPVLRSAVLLFVLAVFILWLAPEARVAPFWLDLESPLLPVSMMARVVSALLWCGLPVLLWLAVLFHLKQREVS